MRRAVVVLVLLAACGGGDESSSDPTTTAATEVEETTTTEIEGTTTTIASSCDAEGSEEATGDELMLTLLCERRAAIEDLETELGIAAPTLERASAIREQACSASFTRPTRDQIEVQHGVYIRGTAQQDEATARRWLAAGILDVFERTDNDDGTFSVNLEFNLEVIARLADADERILDALEERRVELCS